VNNELDAEQGSSEWLEWRRARIGASDAPVIMDVCPYKTAYQLWQEKMGLYTPKVTPQMQYGTNNEGNARVRFIEMTGIIVFPGLREHRLIPYMSASLDGISSDGEQILEIKCNGAKNHSIAKDGEVPKNHYPQLQHQMEVCELGTAYYFSYHEDEGVILKVERNQRYIDEMLIKQKEFWECVQQFNPPELTSRDYMLRQDPVWCERARNYLQSVKTLKRFEAMVQEEKQDLILLSQGKNICGGGIKLSKRMRKGAVDYSRMKELENIDLNKYRRPTTEYWTILEE
jgi:putative phage-type endonuclease